MRPSSAGCQPARHRADRARHLADLCGDARAERQAAALAAPPALLSLVGLRRHGWGWGRGCGTGGRCDSASANDLRRMPGVAESSSASGRPRLGIRSHFPEFARSWRVKSAKFPVPRAQPPNDLRSGPAKADGQLPLPQPIRETGPAPTHRAPPNSKRAATGDSTPRAARTPGPTRASVRGRTTPRPAPRSGQQPGSGRARARRPRIRRPRPPWATGDAGRPPAAPPSASGNGPCANGPRGRPSPESPGRPPARPPPRPRGRGR
jgi:hypothetical protein